MAGLLASLFLIFLVVFGGVVFVRLNEQHELDRKRRTYLLNFPSDVDPENVTELFRQLSGTLRPKVSQFSQALGLAKAEQMVRGVPSLVVETWGIATGIRWIMKIPYGYEEIVRGRLEALVPGVQVQRVKKAPARMWVHAVELALNAGHRPLSIHNAVLTSVGVRTPFGQMGEDESLVLQWIITPMTPEQKPEHGTAKSKESGFSALYRGMTEPSKDEITDRRSKLDEPNLLTAVRIGAVASSKSRAVTMVSNVTAAFHATGGATAYFKTEHISTDRVRERIKHGTTPLIPSVQVNAGEMACFVGWPLGDVTVPGQPAAPSRRIPTPSNVLADAKAGIQLGVSNYSGRERPVVLGYKDALVHQLCIGPSGRGKSVYLANLSKQIIDSDHGLILLQMTGNLFDMVLEMVPTRRINDVIVLNLADTAYPVGFNVLKDGDPRHAVNHVQSIFRAFYKEHPSLWANKAMAHGLKTLAEAPDATIVDLLSLLTPTADEVDWARHLRNSVRDPQLKRYWQEIENEHIDKVQIKMEPLHNRFWPIMDSELVNVLGQNKSSFTMEEVVRENKILLVNLASGSDATGGELLAAFIITKLWQTVMANPMPHSPNYLVMDEAHHMLKGPGDLGTMLVEARKYGLGMTIAHQGTYQIPADIRPAIMQNTLTKVVFQTSGDDAREMARVLGAPVTDYDISHLPQFGTMARVQTPTGQSDPFTMSTLPLAQGYGNKDRIIYASRGRYGRPAHQVFDEIMARRTVSQPGQQPTRKPKPFTGDIGF